MVRAESTLAPGWESKQNSFKFHMLFSLGIFGEFGLVF
jgi:hypothetical protein